MKRNNVLIDSSFLYALYQKDDRQHQSALAVTSIPAVQFIIPIVVLPETAFLFNRNGGLPAVTGFLDALILSNPLLQDVTIADLSRAREIMTIYADARVLDFVDCCIVALAERLNVVTVCTFDRRDFSILRLKNGNALEILP